jgi:di/tricarboxylate transporter
VNPSHLALFAILAGAFGLLVTERLRNDLVAILVVLALWATRVPKPGEALSGFASEPAIVVAAIFVLGAALHQIVVVALLAPLVWRG